MLKRLSLLLLFVFPICLFAETFTIGKDYERLAGLSSPSKDTITVTEFFSYGCPWCFRIDANLTRWKTEHAKKVQFRRVPVVFNKDWEKYAEAFYVIQELNLEPSFHERLFAAIQTNKQALNTSNALVDFFTQAGVKETDLKTAFAPSTLIDLRVAEGTRLMSQYQIHGVPAVVVNGQYKTDLQMAQGEERFFKIIDFLIDLSQKKSSV